MVRFDCRMTRYCKPETEADRAGDPRWLLALDDAKELTEDEQRDAVHKAVGISDLKFELIKSSAGDAAAYVADTFQENRIFLAGDAAHYLPPYPGGYDADTVRADISLLLCCLAQCLRAHKYQVN